MDTLPASINTFGFGYGIKSGLLKSIAEVCQGNYAFIPDAGMIVCLLLLPASALCMTQLLTPDIGNSVRACCRSSYKYVCDAVCARNNYP